MNVVAIQNFDGQVLFWKGYLQITYTVLSLFKQ